MSKSTLINNLPKNDASNTENNDEESMMVNSILEEIQQEDEKINDENEGSLNYVTDQAQIPPQINNNPPSKEMIEEATRDLFQKQNNEVTEILNTINEKQDEILNKETENNKLNNDDTDLIKKTETNVENLVNNLIDKSKMCLVILIFFILLNIPILNKYLLKCIPRLSDGHGNINMICIILKGIILSLIYLAFSFCI